MIKFSWFHNLRVFTKTEHLFRQDNWIHTTNLQKQTSSQESQPLTHQTLKRIMLGLCALSFQEITTLVNLSNNRIKDKIFFFQESMLKILKRFTFKQQHKKPIHKVNKKIRKPFKKLWKILSPHEQAPYIKCLQINFLVQKFKNFQKQFFCKI